MKKTIFLTAFICLLAISAFAQDKKTDFSGTWQLDVSKSKLDERMRVEEMTMTVAQTEKELSVDTKIKRAPRPEGASPMGERRGGGMGRGGFGGGGDLSVTYSLDGKETTSPAPGGQFGGVMTHKAEFEKSGNLKLVTNRSFESPMGSVTIKTEEIWSLSSDGKTLTVKREQSTPRGSASSEMVFNKK